MDTPPVRYVITDDDVRIAYQVFGAGPPVVFVNNVFSHLEGFWEFETLRRLYERMAANVEVVMFDHRGSGMSDGFVEPPSLEDRFLDITAVMDAAEMETASLVGFEVGAQIALGFAVAHPERVHRLVLTNALVGPSAYQRADAMNSDADRTGPISGSDTMVRNLDTVGVEVDELVPEFSPSVVEEELQAAPRFMAKVGSRDSLRRVIASVADLDVAELAPQLQVPTLVAHTKANRLVHVGYARLLAELIPDSTLVEFDGDDHVLWIADNWREIIDDIMRFITQTEVSAPVQRRLCVVMFTDIVGSTEAAMSSGDDRWRQKLDAHDRIATKVVESNDGTIIKHTGDGILAVFNAPSPALAAAVRLRDELASWNIQIRAGIHAGEVELRGDDVSGAVVNLAARVEQAAATGNIYTTSTIKDMLLGTTHGFESVGAHRLKGFAEDWLLYRVNSV